MREFFIVEDVREENNVKQYLIRKFKNSLRPRLYKTLADEIIAAPQIKIDDPGPRDTEGLAQEEQAESVDLLTNEAYIPSKQTIPAMAKKKRSKQGRKKKVKPADNASDPEYELSKAEEQSLPVQRGAPRRRAALQARDQKDVSKEKLSSSRLGY